MGKGMGLMSMVEAVRSRAMRPAAALAGQVRQHDTGRDAAFNESTAGVVGIRTSTSARQPLPRLSVRSHHTEPITITGPCDCARRRQTRRVCVRRQRQHAKPSRLYWRSQPGHGVSRANGRWSTAPIEVRRALR